MNPKKIRRALGKEILFLIADYNPISIDILERLIEPKVSKKRIRKSLWRLRRNGLIEMLPTGGQSFLYQLNQSQRSRQTAQRKMKLNKSVSNQPLLRRQDWFHNQWSFVWESLIKRSFPECSIIRENSLGSDEAARGVLLIDQRDHDVLPDFLMTLPATDKFEQVAIAFEIERTRKSEKRLLRKFSKYLNQTRIDGVIYICDSGRLSETIRIIYREKLISKSLRVNHYGENFLLLSDSLSGGAETPTRLFNSIGEYTDLANWINTLRYTKATARRDSAFKRRDTNPN